MFTIYTMQIKFSKEMDTIVAYARDEAMRTGSYGLGVDHLMLGILRHSDNDAFRLITSRGIVPADMKEAIDRVVFRNRPIPYSDLDTIQPTRSAANVLNMSAVEALKEGLEEVSPLHLLKAICRTEGTVTSRLLSQHRITPDSIRTGGKEKNGTAKVSTPAPNLADIAGAIGEQLSNLIGSAGDELAVKN